MTITDILDKKWVIPTGVAVVSLGGGLISGYLIGMKLGMEKGFGMGIDAANMNMTADVLDALREEIKSEYPVLEYDEVSTESVVELGESVVITDLEEEIVLEVEELDPRELITTNLLTPIDEDWDSAEEEEARLKGLPYIIHRDEFLENDSEYNQEQLTYYAGDDKVCGVDDQIIYNYSSFLGDLKFGKGSGDKKVVYIRNDSLRREYEVIRDPGHYSVEVGGLSIQDEYEEADIQHSNHHKFRDE